jgi:cell division protein FtsN
LVKAGPAAETTKIDQAIENVAPVADAAAASKPPVQPYYLELGTFSNPANASQLRISLLLAGVDAEVIKIRESNQDVYYVRYGSFPNMGQAKAKQERLMQKGVTSTIKKT